MKLTLGQLNLVVGDISHNTEKIINAIEQARDENCSDLVIFPELALCSYPPEDLLLRPAFEKHIESALELILKHAGGIDVLVGHPHYHDGNIYNACSLMRNGGILFTYHKQHLPNYGVFDEKRYFLAGEELKTFEIDSTAASISICEDMWFPGIINAAADAGARVMFNLNASPFDKNKHANRIKIIARHAAQAGMYVVYCNLTGGQDELVFDGNSMIVDDQGKIRYQAPAFEEGLYHYCLDLNAASDTPETTDTPIEKTIYQALVTGVGDYVRKNNVNGVVIGLSGGIDSALTTSIAVDALGPENVEVVIMPSRYTAQMSIDDAVEQATRLGIEHSTISIEPAFEAFLASLSERFAGLPADLTEENIQARCRGILLMAISNKSGRLVLATGNKSEMAVGYATLYGDMCGGFAPLKDVWKTQVYQLANWRNQQQGVIPENVIRRPPTAELRDNQLDQDSLPGYDILDNILERYIEQDESPETISPDYDADMVNKVVHMVGINEYKRRQAAPGVRITERAFDRDRRYPITSGYLEK